LGVLNLKCNKEIQINRMKARLSEDRPDAANVDERMRVDSENTPLVEEDLHRLCVNNYWNISSSESTPIMISNIFSLLNIK
jgi:hypothetical protein